MQKHYYTKNNDQQGGWNLLIYLFWIIGLIADSIKKSFDKDTRNIVKSIINRKINAIVESFVKKWQKINGKNVGIAVQISEKN